MKYSLFVLLLICLVFGAQGQDIEFGKVSLESLEEARYEPDITAHASVLFKKEVHFYKMRQGMPYAMTMVHERIKFYDLLDLEYAKKTIFLSRGEEGESLDRFSAQVYNLENGEIKISKVDTRSIKKETTRDLTILNIDFPDVKAGSIIEYTYLKESPIFWFKEDILCQYTIPIKSLQVSIEHIDQVKFIHHVVGSYPLRVKETVRDSTNTKSAPSITSYFASNVPAINQEPYVDNLANYGSAIIFELDYIHIDYSRETVAKTWSEVGKELAKSKEYRKCFNRDRYYEDAVANLIDKAESPKAKVDALYGFVKDSLVWNDVMDKIPENGCAKTFKERTGNSADLNLLLVSMLQHVGLKAYPVVLSTIDNFRPIYPLPDFLNYVVTAVEFDGKTHFLDASDNEAELDRMSLRLYNGEGLLLNNDKDTYYMVPMELNTVSKATSIVTMSINEEGTIYGNLRSQFTNYEADYFKYDLKRLGREEFIDIQQDFYQGIEISKFELENLDGDDSQIIQNFDFEYTSEENLERVGGDELLVYPLTFLRDLENPFVKDYRMSPIYFGYPKNKVNSVTFNIPEGYEVEKLPEPLMLRLPNDVASYKFQIDQRGNRIMIASTFEINQVRIDVDNYESVKAFFQRMVDIQNEPILLKKSKK